jgi:HK97 family phage major capsid protein/HK97 family phage prohead protease
MEEKKIEYRNFKIDSNDENSRTVEMSVSSEAPVSRNWNGIQGREILDHSPGSVDLSRFENGSGALLLDHDPEKMIGVIDSIRLDESQRKLRATARFGNSALAKEAFQDVVDRIRTNVSIGYNVNNFVQEDSENREESPTFRVDDWTLLEISSVSIPADINVGVGRAQNKKPSHHRIEPMENIVQENLQNHIDDREKEKLRNEGAKTEAQRAEECWQIAGRNNLPHDMVQKAVYEDKVSVADFRGLALDYREKEGMRVQALEDNTMGLSNGEIKRFSLAKILWAEANPHDRSAQEAAAYERDVVTSFQKESTRTGKGLTIPEDIIMSKPLDGAALVKEGRMKRDWNTTDATGGYLVETQLVSFIDRLRHYLFLTDVGITELRGLNGPINIPRLTASQTAYWVAEGGDLTESQGTLDQVSLTPKTVGAFSQVTRRLLEEAKTSYSVETLIIDDMAKQIAAAIQDKALSGNGASNTPTGLYNSSISTKSCTDQNDPTWAEVIGTWSTVAGNRALSLPRDEFAFACPSGVAGNMMAKTKDSGSGRFVMEDDFRILGYPVMVSELCSQLTFGAWRQLIIAYWSGLDLLTDPFTAGKSGTVNFYALQDVDVGVRLPTAFCKTTT